MLDRLQALADRYDKLSELLCDPDVASDSKRLRDYSKNSRICSRPMKHTLNIVSNRRAGCSQAIAKVKSSTMRCVRW